MLEIIAGWEPREEVGYQVCAFSARRRNPCLHIMPLREKVVRYRNLYWRPHEQRDGQLWDVVSRAPMATSFANSRFLTPWLAQGEWALFCDFSDMLFLADPAELFALADERYAVQVVKHTHIPDEAVKMDNQAQTVYPRKNWSSVILWNCTHPSNANLTLEMVNELPGRDLHRFFWLDDEEIGELPAEWNYLVGVDGDGVTPKLLHYTKGIPTMLGYENGPWADVWKRELEMLDSTKVSNRGPREAHVG